MHVPFNLGQQRPRVQRPPDRSGTSFSIDPDRVLKHALVASRSARTPGLSTGHRVRAQAELQPRRAIASNCLRRHRGHLERARFSRPGNAHRRAETPATRTSVTSAGGATRSTSQ